MPSILRLPGLVSNGICNRAVGDRHNRATATGPPGAGLRDRTPTTPNAVRRACAAGTRLRRARTSGGLPGSVVNARSSRPRPAGERRQPLLSQGGAPCGARRGTPNPAGLRGIGPRAGRQESGRRLRYQPARDGSEFPDSDISGFPRPPAGRDGGAPDSAGAWRASGRGPRRWSIRKSGRFRKSGSENQGPEDIPEGHPRRTSQKNIEARPRNRVSLTAPKRGDGLKRRPSRRHRPPRGGRNRGPLPARAGKAQEPAGVGTEVCGTK